MLHIILYFTRKHATFTRKCVTLTRIPSAVMVMSPTLSLIIRRPLPMTWICLTVTDVTSSKTDVSTVATSPVPGSWKAKLRRCYENLQMQYTAIFEVKYKHITKKNMPMSCIEFSENENFQLKVFDILNRFVQNIDCGYT